MRKSVTTHGNESISEHQPLDRISDGHEHELDPKVDMKINIHELTTEFQNLAIVLFRYYSEKAELERQYDVAKAEHEEMEAHILKQLKLDTTLKRTEAHIGAEVKTNPQVISLRNKMHDLKRDWKTVDGGVKSLEAKKDMLMQLGADRRKENK